MKVVKLTQEQAEQLQGVEFVADNLFNPVLDADGNWFISIEEQDQCSIQWVKECPLIDYNPIQVNLF